MIELLLFGVPALIAFIIFIVVVSLRGEVNRLRSRVETLYENIIYLDWKIKQFSGEKAPTAHTSTATSRQSATHKPTQTATPNVGSPSLSTSPKTEISTASVPTAVMSKATAKTKPKTNPKLAALKKEVSENWTGILGSIIVVAGVAFFGIWASFFLGPVGKFSIIIAFATILLGTSLWLRRIQMWRLFGSWLQAASGAVALFACLGAGGITGLQFIHNPIIALAVLSAGIIFNLVFAYTTATQTIASLHVVLSLCALMIAPQTPTIFVLGTLVTVAGLLLSYRGRWEINLLLSIGTFAVFHFYWLYHQPLPASEFRLLGILCALAVGIAGGLVHYRREYQSTQFDWLPFLAHSANWVVLGTNLVHYATGSKLSVYLLGTAAVVACAMGRLAKIKQIRWLQKTDTLVGQLLALLAISQLGRFGLAHLEIVLIALCEVTLFNIMVQWEKDTALIRIGALFHWITLAALPTFALYEAPDILSDVRLSLVLVIAAITQLGYLILAHSKDFIADTFQLAAEGKTEKWTEGLSLVALGTPLLALSAYFFSLNTPLSAPMAALGFLLICSTRIRYENPGLNFGLFFAVGMFHLLSWQRLFSVMGTEMIPWLYYGISPLLLDCFLLIPAAHRSLLKPTSAVRWVVYLFAGHLAVLTFTLTNPISDFVPGVSYLIYSLLALELGQLLPKRWIQHYKDYLIHAGYFFLGLFFSRHLTVHLQSELSLGIFSIREVIAGFGLIVLGYWLKCGPKLMSGTQSKLNRWIPPLLVEATLAFLTLCIALEVNSVWHPVAWIGLALLFVFQSENKMLPARLSFYGWLLYLASCGHLAFVSSTYASGATLWYLDSHYVGLIAMSFQMVFVAFTFRRRTFHQSFAFPKPLGLFEGIQKKFVQKHSNMAIFYPLLICVAIFLFWRFDRAVLTLLWVAEIFVVFSLGMFLKERHFIHVANAVLVFLVGRLVLYDLSKTDISIRAIVFVGIGLLMLSMNAIYKKYKGRVGT